MIFGNKPHRTHFRRGGRAISLVALAVLAVGAALSATSFAAQKGNYTYEEDPIRLGRAAFDKGQLAEAKSKFEEAVRNEYKVDRGQLGLADVAVREGHFREAEQFYRLALAASDNARFSEAHAGLGLVLLRMGEEDAAEKELITAWKQKPGLWTAAYGQARLLLKRGDGEKAKKFLESGKDKKGLIEGEDLYHFGMALYAEASGDLKTAESEALRALNLNPQDLDYSTALVRIYQDKGVPALAIKAFEEVLRSPGVVPTASMYHTLGRLNQDASRYNEARDWYVKAVETDSTYAPAFKDLAELLHKADQHERAAQVYLRYVQMEPNDTNAQVGLSESCTEIRRYTRALEAATSAWNQDSTRVDVRFAWARAAIHGTDRKVQGRAVQVYASLPADAPWVAQDHVLMATYHVAMKNFSSAQAELSKALAMEPGNAEGNFQQGLLHLTNQRPDSAIAWFEKAATRNPSSSLYQLNLGVAYVTARKFEAAFPAFRKAITLDPKAWLPHVLLGQALASADSISSAEEQYRDALKLEPNNAKGLRGLGFCQLRMGYYAEAVQTYQGATTAEPGSADGWIGLGQALLGMRDWEGAREAFSRAQKIAPDNPSLMKGLKALAQATGG